MSDLQYLVSRIGDLPHEVTSIIWEKVQATMRAMRRWVILRNAITQITIKHYMRAHAYARHDPTGWYPDKYKGYLRPTESGRPLNLIGDFRRIVYRASGL